MALDGLYKDVLLLRRLTLFPEPPHDNNLISQPTWADEGRKLPISHELGIVNALSFLTAYSDDKSKVAAFCVEEVNEDQDRLHIRVAVNDEQVGTIKHGLDGIARFLMEQNVRGMSEFNTLSPLCSVNAAASDILAVNLLRHVVCFNRMRILRRLRSSQAPQRGRVKPALLSSLAAAWNETKLQNEVPKEKLALLASKTGEHLEVFGALESMDKSVALSDRSADLLIDIIQRIDEMIQQDQLLETLELIHPKSGHFSSGRKQGLIEGLQKLVQYIGWTNYLLSLAQRMACFRKITVLPISLGPTRLNLGADQSKVMGRPSMLEGLVDNQINTNSALISQLESRLGTSIPETQALIGEQAKSEHTVHAEMQLLFFYEQQPQAASRPRVISASKNACFLCNQFMALHGGFYTPKTHGRLYAEWRLAEVTPPTISPTRKDELHSMYDKLHKIVQKEILVALESPSSIPVYENESRVNLIPALGEPRLELALPETELVA